MICGLSLCSQCLQAYLIWMCSMRSKWPGKYSICQVILLRSSVAGLSAAGAGLLVFAQVMDTLDHRQLVEAADVAAGRV